MMDHSYDYLLPTCMLKRRAMMKNGPIVTDPSPTSLYMDTIFDDTLKALEEDTCSEISDRSYADASYYTQMKLWNSPYLERPFYSDLEDTPQIPKNKPKSNTSQFDLSLQQFLEWPDSSGGQDSDYEVSLHEVSNYEATKSKRKSVERRKRATRIHNSLRTVVPQKRLSIPKVEIESESDCSPQSEDEVFDDSKYSKIDSKKVSQSTVPYRSSLCEESQKLTQLALKSKKNADSDSDYRTYSDTSSEKLDTNFTSNVSESHRDVDFTPLKSLMLSVLQKSESVSSRLQQSNHECITKDGAQEQKSTSVKIMPILGKQGGDLEHFKKLLEKVQDLLTQGETAVESLQLQLKDERCACKERMEADEDIKRLQEEVEDLQGKLDEKAKEAENKSADIETIAKQLDVLDTHSKNGDSDMLHRILSEIHLLQGINSAVNPLQLPSLSCQGGGNSSNHQQRYSATKYTDNMEFSDQPMTALQDENKNSDKMDSRLLIVELTVQIDDLKKTLKATEETVHCQTHKMKYYRNILFENGLLHEPRSRSNSVPISMTKKRPESEVMKRRNSEEIQCFDHCTNVSPTTMIRRHLDSSEVLESKEDMEKLFKENSKLKEQVNGYRRVLKVFQGKRRNSVSELEGSLEADSQHTSVESAQCILDCWFGIVNKFLSNLSQSDQDGHLQHLATSTDVTRLKTGLREAKAAVRTLAEFCNNPEEKYLEGRLSPDSGCSDNSTSAQKMMNFSPSNSPRSNYGSTLSVRNHKRQRETGSRDAGASPNHYLQKRRKSFDVTPRNENEMDIISHSVCGDCNMCSMKEKKTSIGSRLGVPTICVRDCAEGVSYENELFRQSDFKHDLSKLNEEHSELDNENYSNKSRQCCNRSIKMLQNESKQIEASTKELHSRMKSLEKVLRSYEERVQKQFRPDIDSLKDHLKELHDLRVLLEKHMNHNEVLENDLRKMNNSSDQTIQDLNTQLTQCNKIIQEKIKMISEKDIVIKESNKDLEICKNNSSKISAELKLCHKRVASLDKELKSEKDTVNQLTVKCKQLEMEIDRYNKPLNVKNHDVGIISYKDWKSDADVNFNTDLDIPELKTRIEELEIVAVQWSQNKSKYKDMLTKSTSEVSKLTSDLEDAKEGMNNTNLEMEHLKAELESSRDTVEEQTVLLCDKTRVIDGLNCELQKQNIILYEQDSLCRELTSKLEDVNTVNGKLSTRLDLDKHICADYKQQSDKQNQVIHDLKDRIANLKAELTLSVQMRKSQDKIMIKEKKDVYETMKLKDKYLYNLKMTYRELSKAKKDLKDEHRKLEEISSVNRSLQTELKVRERLMDKKGDGPTNDDKQNMITELLNELKVLRQQITTIQEQNSIMKARLSQFNRHNSPKGLKSSTTTDKPRLPVGTADQLKKLSVHTGIDKCNTDINRVTSAVTKNMNPNACVNEISTRHVTENERFPHKF